MKTISVDVVVDFYASTTVEFEVEDDFDGQIDQQMIGDVIEWDDLEPELNDIFSFNVNDD